MQTTPIGLPRPSYTNRQFADIASELLAYVAQVRPDLLADFSDQSGVGSVLIDLMALVGDLVAFGQDTTAAEYYLAFNKRYASALRFARSVGYVPRTAAASVAVLAGPASSALTATGGTAVAGQSVTAGDLRFELLADLVVTSGATTVTASLVQGESFEDTFDPTAARRMKVTTSQGVVADQSWRVYVGSTASGNLWTQVPNVALETTPTHAYSVSFDEQGRLEVQFGDGVSGAIPGAVVIVQYRTTVGSAGNLSAGAVAGSLTFNLVGGGTTVVSLANASAASGGYDREGIDEMRVNIPAYIRSGDTLNDIRDYDAAPMRVAGVKLSYADLARQSYAANIVSVAFWEGEDVTFTSESVLIPARTSVPYSRYKQGTTTIGDNVQAYLRDRTSVAILPQVVRPPVAWVDLYMRRVVYDQRYARDTVHLGVTQAVVGVFEQSGGFAVRLSSLYDAVVGVPGVRSLSIDRLVFQYSSKTKASGSVSLPTGFNPVDGNTVTIGDGVSTITFEFDSNGAVASGNVAVIIGLSAHDTMANLASRVNVSLAGVLAVKTNDAVPTCALYQRTGGLAYNVPIAKQGGALAVVGLSGGSDTVSLVTEDRRLAPSQAFDPWPPGPYVTGSPFTGTSPWQDGGVTPYAAMADPEIVLPRLARRYYDEALTYNNEIIYNQTAELTSAAQAVNLRRLVFELVAE